MKKLFQAISVIVLMMVSGVCYFTGADLNAEAAFTGTRSGKSKTLTISNTSNNQFILFMIDKEGKQIPLENIDPGMSSIAPWDDISLPFKIFITTQGRTEEYEIKISKNVPDNISIKAGGGQISADQVSGKPPPGVTIGPIVVDFCNKEGAVCLKKNSQTGEQLGKGTCYLVWGPWKDYGGPYGQQGRSATSSYCALTEDIKFGNLINLTMSNTSTRQFNLFIGKEGEVSFGHIDPGTSFTWNDIFRPITLPFIMFVRTQDGKEEYTIKIEKNAPDNISIKAGSGQISADQVSGKPPPGVTVSSKFGKIIQLTISNTSNNQFTLFFDRAGNRTPFGHIDPGTSFTWDDISLPFMMAIEDGNKEYAIKIAQDAPDKIAIKAGGGQISADQVSGKPPPGVGLSSK